MKFESLFLGHGFGLNTDIFETNVINLAIVLVVVISVGGDALRDTLSSRKQNLKKSFDLAREREEEAESQLQSMRLKLQDAQRNAERISHSGDLKANEEVERVHQRSRARCARNKFLKALTVYLERRRIVTNIAGTLISASLERAEDHLRSRAKKRSFQDWVLNYRLKHDYDLSNHKRLFLPS